MDGVRTHFVQPDGDDSYLTTDCKLGPYEHSNGLPGCHCRPARAGERKGTIGIGRKESDPQKPNSIYPSLETNKDTKERVWSRFLQIYPPNPERLCAYGVREAR